MTTERNHKKRLGTYVRNFPEDLQAQKRLDAMIGHTALEGHLANISASAMRRQNKRDNEAASVKGSLLGSEERRLQKTRHWLPIKTVP